MAAASFPQGVGVVELVPDAIEVRPDYAYEAIKLEIVNANGDGIETLVDQPLAFDLVLRLVAACMRLRRLTP
jgi:hypothetical protein